MVAQTCTIRSGNYVQGAVIVRNNRPTIYNVGAVVYTYDDLNGSSLGAWLCPNSGVAAHSWSVCFGATIVSGHRAYSGGTANNNDLYYSGSI
jgi:hypothetical protein